MKYFWEGSREPFAENVDGIASFFGQNAEMFHQKALAGSRIVNENGVPCSWDDVIGLIAEEPPGAVVRKHEDGDTKPRERSDRKGAARSKSSRWHS